ncbi:MAG: hypothetical protein JSW34_12295 [Candidatus Zixiibacteriota bacterium]|nr:MAG: hypothetical protein JSW34_12295 [candidate division Zixibacteria bacterium]
MTPRESEASTLLLLIEHELALKEFYEACAEAFPEHKNYWLEIASDEAGHAEAIRDLFDVTVTLNMARFKSAAVATSLSYVKDSTAQLNGGAYTMNEALATALDFEKAMIDGQFFEIFNTDSQKCIDVYRKLAEDTRNHVKKIESQWVTQRVAKDS